MDQISNSNLLLGDCSEKLLSIEPGTVDLKASFNLAQKDIQRTFIGRDILSFIPILGKNVRR